MLKPGYRNLLIFVDIAASAVAWAIFFGYRKVFVETVKFGVDVPFDPDYRFISGLLLIPLFWFILHYSGGAYNDVKRKSLVSSMVQLFATTTIGVITIFFLALLDDTVISYKTYYQSFLLLFTLQLSLTLMFRIPVFFYRNRCLHSKRDSFRVALIGNHTEASLLTEKYKPWFDREFLEPAGIIADEVLKPSNQGESALPSLQAAIGNLKAEEVIVTGNSRSREELERIVLLLFSCDVNIRILPEYYPLSSIPVKIADIEEAPFLVVSRDILPGWQHSIKVFTDIVISGAALVLLLPLSLVLAVVIRLTSAGPVIYSQERVGKYGRVFNIYKFRSMYTGAEPDGPMLATFNDKRITPVGRFMRKHRFDEIPNFINVLRGEMSLVGPRPERAYFISQITSRAPGYAKLHLVKPGITSWGQVKYGYAGDLDKMISRMRYDLVYIENMSLYVDMQILLKTIGIIIRGQGI